MKDEEGLIRLFAQNVLSDGLDPLDVAVPFGVPVMVPFGMAGAEPGGVRAGSGAPEAAGS
ncbi:hypothetical protein [Streptomyces varsoviensis]|uniref:Uncharacterized protein n=1 Tax=Streptomyces varsoviensis TaxID=67373 RepID=A0ABR5J931_9ACTN|nr:hypothetical protein [Streptomyces varsoviensis]KOG89956.1 hypothetical protein ADK38_11335 [Streptomyces varsoviensis]